MSRWKQVPPQPSRTFLVTGASSGVGLATADALAQAGARVIMAVRNRVKGEEAAATISPANGGSVEIGVVDLADQTSVRTFAATVGEIDVLINNAGVLGVPYELTPEGVEMHFATNHLGHYSLTNLLLPRIRERVVVVASASHKTGDLQLDDLDWARRGYKAYAAYAASKLANLQFLTELDRRLREAPSPVRATGAHPGTTGTNITAHSTSRLRKAVGGWGHQLTGMPPWKGALPSLYAATEDVPGNSYIGPTGMFELYGWPGPASRTPASLDTAASRALWDRSAELTGIDFQA
ncbi:putative short-chain dehydrogenase/reductase [Nocardioides baekrokdamisoli]|uniref:Putative short-chain dehydrogenase/reductase n=1 Tax=Nocardioides baekrokdamisoli TaxID=1804624 RepID=A0A3G9J5B2_9ACTN|nr:SDR family NAD(P)-dependent oxidoreductase [Nocardioides baekrokdamisoli]BBH18524.1 putative short-chain dehydrogenase/reductase [Nocardioides baekrokdamisoli]